MLVTILIFIRIKFQNMRLFNAQPIRMDGLRKGAVIIFETGTGKIILHLCVYEPITMGVITVSVENVELVLVTNKVAMLGLNS